MPAKVPIHTLLTRHLGKKIADAMVAKIHTRIHEKKSAAQIEREIIADLTAHLKERVTAARQDIKTCLPACICVEADADTSS
ncbi:MAG: hypothetical protein ABSE56_23880 [Bryobacteraceae bacterium]